MYPFVSIWRHFFETFTNTSLAGIILARLGCIPAEGDTVRLGRALLEVVKMDGRRIDRVLIRPIDDPEPDRPNHSADATAQEKHGAS